ncbi:MAG: META domain-containing protein [Dehalococcoidia bacterium]|nr:META domain-containing protein [Dehalococcoidia bacterium]
MKTEYAVLVTLIAISLIAFAACGVLDSGVSDTSLADGPRWILESIDGNPLVEGTFLWLRLSGDRSGGFDGCNKFGGRSEDGKPAARANGTFLSPPYGMTNIGCDDAVLDQGDTYIDALAEGRRFQVSDGRLEILNESGEVRLAFVKQSPLPGQPADLTGTAWRLMVEGDDEARPATLVFLNDHWATGVTACRGYVAGYSVSEESIRFPSQSMTETEVPCLDVEALRRKEAEFTTDLSRTNEYSIHNEESESRLYLRTSRGRSLIFEEMEPATTDAIANTDWRLRALIEDRPDDRFPYTDDIPAGSEFTISFRETIVSGLADCHSFEASSSVEGSQLTISSLTTTERKCEYPEGSSEKRQQYLKEQALRYLDLLPRMNSYRIFGDGLFVRADDDTGLLFEAE